MNNNINQNIYKGNPFSGFRAMLLLLYLVGLVYWLFQHHSKSIEIFIIFFLVFFIVWALFYCSYYFTISGDSLIVQNHYKFWFKKEYKFDDIEEIVFEQKSKAPGSVRIITRNHNKSYWAETITDRKWIEFKDELEKRKVPIRDGFIDAIVFFEFTLFKEIKQIFNKQK